MKYPKPETDDDLNYSLHGCVVRFLLPDEKIAPGDFVRELYETAFDGGGWDGTYKPEHWRGTFWHKASDELPGWVSKTYKEYLQFCGDNRTPTRMRHEIARVIG